MEEKKNIQAIKAAIYTRKSSEEGLELEFNSLDAQREACESYIKSQKMRVGSWWKRNIQMVGLELHP